MTPKQNDLMLLGVLCVVLIGIMLLGISARNIDEHTAHQQCNADLSLMHTPSDSIAYLRRHTCPAE